MIFALGIVALFTGSALAVPSPAPKCSLLFDGRVPLMATAADFDKETSVFDDKYVHGQNQTWSEILKFPFVLPSLFDITNLSKAVEVTLSDRSIFVPGGGAPQVGFRRSELIPAGNNGTDATVQGSTTFHWSVRDDPHRPLNYSHEYHGGWHETNDYSSSQFNFKLGTPFDPQGESISLKDPRNLRITTLQSQHPEEVIFHTSFIKNVWHNFALTVGWEDNTITVYYSHGYDALTRVAGPTYNPNTGGGQFHLGVFKLPTGPLGIDVLHEGYQSLNLNEGLIYGGIFIEDSSEGCVTLKP
ncbi:hypothetical protein BKA62DRAFT_755916 [Auriculariales sp. MPI-PUGE-AT-0066]|nr:hypothetical protein BKA62DRAFT_755916 [Auriculariales sp. MPI-PUGE-AT-0066]